jgi:hypothetical protein
MYRRSMQRTVVVHYQVQTAGWVPAVVVQVAVCPCETTAGCKMLVYLYIFDNARYRNQNCGIMLRPGIYGIMVNNRCVLCVRWNRYSYTAMEAAKLIPLTTRPLPLLCIYSILYITRADDSP